MKQSKIKSFRDQKMKYLRVELMFRKQLVRGDIEHRRYMEKIGRECPFLRIH